MNTNWHFPVMIFASLIVFFIIVRIALTKKEYVDRFKAILFLAFVVVVLGMTFGKYGATYGLPWWIYYPVPMLATVLLPPLILKLSKTKTMVYLLLSFLSAPFIHVIFSFLFGWTEYMPFWKIPQIGTLINLARINE
jgi:hypothetical protein